MTEEYKDTLLKYLTGSINDEETPNEIIGYPDEQQVVTNNLADYLSEIFSSTYTIEGILHSETYDNAILYGSRRMNGTNYGFLLIVDNNFNPIQVIESYDTGTSLGRFYKLEVDEKNQLYGIDYNPETTKYRFIMLNNVFASGIAKLRQSYNLPSEVTAMNFTNIQITKDPSSANYLIAGVVFQGNVNQPKVAKLTVNVGATNEWVYYSYSGTLLGAESKLSNIYADWGAENVQFKITAFSDYQFLVYSSWYYNDETLIDVELYDIGDNWTSSTIYDVTSIVADINTCYYGVHATADGYETLNLYMIKDGVQKLINAYSLSEHTSDENIKYHFTMKNGVLLYSEIVPNGSNYNVIGGIYRDGIINETFFIVEDIYIYNPIFNVLNSFNLYKYNFQIENTLYSIKLLYNSNVNFIPHTTGYNTLTDLKPLTMSLYEDNELLFNRNLYNLVVSGSTATSTVEVPNTMLNSNTINKENLIGNHYLQIANNVEEITTNEYETLHINSINTLSMINLDNNVLNPTGSSRLNSSANLVQDYENAKATKIRINYTDNTNYVYKLGSNQIAESNGVYIYTFVVYASKPITNVQIISNDEITTYQTITGTFEQGKYYQITQEVTI